jgi:pre-mRNA-processing factor 17
MPSAVLMNESGHVEEQAMDDRSFLIQQRTFDVHGYALNPNAQNGQQAPVIGSLQQAHENGYMSIEDMRVTNSQKKEMKRKRGGKGDAGVVDGEDAYMGPWAGWQGDKEVEPVVEEEAEEWREEKRRREEATALAKEKMKEAREEKSIFHGTFTCRRPNADQSTGKELLDYAGRSYLHIPTDTDVKLNPSDGAAPPNAYLPERCIHTWVCFLPVEFRA